MASLRHDVVLTPRLRDVVELICCGLTNPEIAAELHISLNTTKTHIRRLAARVGARDRAALAVWALWTGAVVLPGVPGPTEP